MPLSTPENQIVEPIGMRVWPNWLKSTRMLDVHEGASCAPAVCGPAVAPSAASSATVATAGITLASMTFFAHEHPSGGKRQRKAPGECCRRVGEGNVDGQPTPGVDVRSRLPKAKERQGNCDRGGRANCEGRPKR